MTTDYVKRHRLKPTMRAFSVNDTMINGAPEHKGYSTASRLCFPFGGCSVCYLRSPNETSQLLFWRLSSMDLFMSNRCTHLKIFATRPTCLQKRARCFCAWRIMMG